MKFKPITKLILIGLVFSLSSSNVSAFAIQDIQNTVSVSTRKSLLDPSKAISKFIEYYGRYSKLENIKKEIQQGNSKRVLGASISSLPLSYVSKKQLRKQIGYILGNQKSKYGVYIFDLKRKIRVGYNINNILPPASISKVPVAVLILREVQAGRLSLDKKYPIKGFNKPYTHDVMANEPNGTMHTLRRYLRFSIVYSDNTANATLEWILGGYKVVNRKTKNQLGINYFFRYPHISTANDIGIVFKGIYAGRYLEPKYNKYILKYLLNTASHLQDGIPASLPIKTPVAHKTGQLPSYVWEDAGIIYGTHTDFVMVVINRGITYGSARNKTQRIAKKVYYWLNR